MARQVRFHPLVGTRFGIPKLSGAGAGYFLNNNTRFCLATCIESPFALFLSLAGGGGRFWPDDLRWLR